MKRLLLLGTICMALAVGGCEKEETYQGKPMSEWISLAQDRDYATREKAVTALGRMKSSKAKHVLTNIVETDETANASLRLHAYKALWGHITREEDARYLSRAIDDYLRSQNGALFTVTDEEFAVMVIGRVRWQGAASADLKPKVMQLRNYWAGMTPGYGNMQLYVRDLDAVISQIP